MVDSVRGSGCSNLVVGSLYYLLYQGLGCFEDARI